MTIVGHPHNPPLVQLAYDHGYAVRCAELARARLARKRVECGFRRPRRHVALPLGPPPHTCVRLYGRSYWDHHSSVMVSVLGLWVRVYYRSAP